MSLKDSLFSVFKKTGQDTPAATSGIAVQAPLKGTLVPLDQVPDEAFSGKILGDGIAIDPTEGLLVSPVNGEVVQIFRTNHAVGLLADSGLEVLLHIGIDTVKMNGEGFRALAKVGQRVRAGDKLIEFDLNLVKAKAKSSITPVIITNMDIVDKVESRATGVVALGQEVLRVEKKA